ncbi:hypothetical protein N7501_004644 [Penicillium viridicatum]|nr:hypothetical protein N7501_004644 [Penicillium viridicatum]
MSSSTSSFAEPKLPQLVPILTGEFYSNAVSTLGILIFSRSSRADTDCVSYLRTLFLALSSIYLYSLQSHCSTEIKAKGRAESDNPIFWGEPLGLRVDPRRLTKNIWSLEKTCKAYATLQYNFIPLFKPLDGSKNC